MQKNLELRRGQTPNPVEMAGWVGAVLGDPEAAIGPKTPLGALRLRSLTGLERLSPVAVRKVIDVIRDAPYDMQAGLGIYISGFPDDMLEELGGITAEGAELYLKTELEANIRSQRVNKLVGRAVDGPDLADPDDEDIAGPGLSRPVQLNGARVSEDSVKDWLRNIGKLPLLNAEQEVQIGRRIEAGLAARAALECWVGFETKLDRMDGEYQSLGYNSSLELRQALEDVARDGEEAKQHMITANLRLVVSISKKYQGRGLSLLDLIQEGNLGLIRAVEKFDYKKGYKVSTYATQWIQQALQRGIANSCSTVRLPVNVHGGVKKMQAIRARLADELGRDPYTKELAGALGWSVNQVEEYRTYERNSLDPLSLSAPLGRTDDGGTLEDVVADLIAEDPTTGVLHSRLVREIDVVLGSLSERNANIVRMAYGLGGALPKTREEIAAKYGISNERVRQILMRSLFHLRRHASGQHGLRDLLNN